MLLFVSNTLTRAVKLSNSLPLPSSVNNGTLHLAVLSDVNKHGHKGIPDTCEGCHATACSLTKRETNKRQKKRGVGELAHVGRREHATQTRRGEKRVRQIFFIRPLPRAKPCFFNAYQATVGNGVDVLNEENIHTGAHTHRQLDVKHINC